MSQASQHQQSALQPATSISTHTLVFIDANLDDYPSLAAGVIPNAEVVILHPAEDGIAQISTALANRRNIQTLHLVCHGDPGTLYLGNTRLNADTLALYRTQIHQWQASLAPNADLLIYGCRVAASHSPLLSQLHHLTRANIAASAAIVGNGNWNLDTHIGTPRSPVAFSPTVQASYTGVFGVAFKGSYDTPHFSLGVNVVGNIAYVADYNSGLQIVDISNPATPTLLGSYDTPGQAWSTAIEGNLAYVADHDSGVHILDISNPATPTLLGSYATPGQALEVKIAGNLAYVADMFQGLRILDISNPANITEVGVYDTPGQVWDVKLAGNLAYVADYTHGLHVLDISNPANPTLVGSYDTPGYAWDVELVGNFAYIADREAGLQVLDVSNPANPTLVGSYDTPDWALDVNIVGNLAYVADQLSGVQVLDISNPANPTLATSFDTPGHARDVRVLGDLAYVADWTQGLQIFNLNPSVLPPVQPPAPIPVDSTPPSTSAPGFVAPPASPEGEWEWVSEPEYNPSPTTHVSFEQGYLSIVLPEPAPETCGSEDGDLITGDFRNDTLCGAGGDDLMAGYSGEDFLTGDEGNDVMFGNGGNDTMSGGNGHDVLFAGKDDDIAIGNTGNDLILGGNGADTLAGGTGDDFIFGNLHSDFIDGNQGNDYLFGGNHDDTLIGGSGRDVLRGDVGNDSLVGGIDSDRFEFRPGSGDDIIADFQDGFDVIGLLDNLSFDKLQIVPIGNDTQIVGNGFTVTLQNVPAWAIDSTDFV
ncbi:MAG TPA: DUF4347 domain-containing protein [Oscillatoriales cyanobacterium M59_W2019_021]|nr:MAG: DUF4347 domain-containing protein [Cyanobacteria bacterium J055]HIK33875.1 DUF4347 domain-containing protein [Oscillatoriales cyanobacterium M4454_W2019_049]HIK51703.1 DUF4347 domain-containing protein [Oscillatoriales cyanobacterium M59_W2019_021]